MKRTYRDYAADMLACFGETQEFTRGLDFDAFARDRKTINAVLRSLEVMGEAAKRIPEEASPHSSRQRVRLMPRTPDSSPA